MRWVSIDEAANALGKSKKTLLHLRWRDQKHGHAERFTKMGGTWYVNLDGFENNHLLYGFVTRETQSEFERLYWKLAETMSDYRIAFLISKELEGKTVHALYMRIRGQFVGGSEKNKGEMVSAMRLIVADLEKSA